VPAGLGVGASVVRVFTAYESGAAARRRPGTGRHEPACADRAAGYGVTLAVQNHHDVALALGSAVELLVDVDRPNVKIGFDAWSPALRGEPVQAARQLAPHTAIDQRRLARVPRYRYVSEVVNYERTADGPRGAVRRWIHRLRFFAGLVERFRRHCQL
jgi:hypothetical protein